MKLISMDVETWGTLPEYALQPCRVRSGDAWLTSFSVCEEGAEPAGTLRINKVMLRKWLLDCAEQNYRIVGWNTPFDVAWLIAMGLREEVYANKWLDGMLLWRHLSVRPDFATPDGKRQSFSLKNAVRTFLPEHANYEEGVSFDPSVNPDKLLEYNKLDAMLTVTLARMFWDQLTDKMRRVAQIEAAAIPMVAEAIVEGLLIDTNAAHELDNKLEADANLALVTLKLTTNEAVTPEILASPKQLSELLFDKWGLTPPKLTDKGATSTDKIALWKLSHVDKRAKLVKDYREAVGNRKKFAENTLASAQYNGDSRTRPQPRIYSTYTARLTYSSKQGRGVNERQIGVALHQWKRDPMFRRVIVPPPGYMLLEFDFAGQEFRWMAVMSKDPTMLKLCMPGEDPHAYMGARIIGWDYDELRVQAKNENPHAKKGRQLGKVANLSLQYRTSAGRLQEVAQVQYDIPMTAIEARTIHGTYQLTYRRVPEYWNRQARHARINGYVENLIGRRVYLGARHTWRSDFKWSYESTAINYPIQSMGAEQKYLALLVLRELLKEFDGRFYFELHDGLFVVVPQAKAEKAAAVIKQKLSNLPYQELWDVELPVEFPVDAKLGPSWGDLKEFEG